MKPRAQAGTVVLAGDPVVCSLAVKRRRFGSAFGACLCAVTVASCGGGERQDANEPEGRFKVEVTRATFPSSQKLAKRSELVIEVRNRETSRTVPNVAVTLDGFDTKIDNDQVADPSRPVFVINGRPKEIGTFPEAKEQAPEGGETAYVGTWALGKLKPGESKSFRWNVTAVRAGSYRVTYEVAAGLDGKAKAVGVGGIAPKGLFIGTVKDEAPDSRVAADGRTVVEDKP